MSKRLCRPCSALLLAVIALVNSAVGQVPAHRMLGNDRDKVVYHINFDDPVHQASALRSIQNHLDSVGTDKIAQVVVVHGDGVSLLLEPSALSHLPRFRRANADQEMTARIDVLRQQGVQFKVCANTLRRRGVNPETDLYNVDPKDIVPNGVAELARLQMQGYAYVKP